MAEKQYKYSEIFGNTFQGEGAYTGKATVWLRFFLCNLQCDGFGQDDPCDSSTYVLPYQTVDVSSIKRLEDLPVFSYGCDSSYSWSARYKHLQHSGTAAELCDRIESLLPHGKFLHPVTNNHHHMAFTGGEPLMKHSQPAIIAMMKEWEARGNLPLFVTIETNGTQPLSADFKEWAVHYAQLGGELFFSVSPKLFNASGETADKAIKPENVAEYFDYGGNGQLKFVVRNSEACLQELDETFAKFRAAGVMWDAYGMPVGATKEAQEDKLTADLAVKLVQRGYHVSGRLHAHIFGNGIGT